MIQYFHRLLVFFILSSNLIFAQTASDDTSGRSDSTKVEISTSLGKIIVSLSNRTPLHRDNFLKLVKENQYNDVLFHRVIKDFMVQAGDPSSKHATSKDTLGSGDVDYKVPAEINKYLFHKRGALAAARDGNPERASSGMQFYIVQGKIYNDSLLDVAEKRINGWLGEYYVLKDPKNNRWQDSLDIAMKAEDFEAYTRLNDTIKAIAKDYPFEKYSIPLQHREVYKTFGGAAHLDQNYTVFGEVISGMATVNSIAAQAVGKFNRPVEDIKILSMKILNE